MEYHGEVHEMQRRAGLLEGRSTILWNNDDFHFQVDSIHRPTYYQMIETNTDRRVGFMTVQPTELKLRDWEEDWLVVDNVGVHHEYQGGGLGRIIYEQVLKHMHPPWAGLVSVLSTRRNVEQIPHLYKSLGAKRTPDGQYWFILNPNHG